MRVSTRCSCSSISTSASCARRATTSTDVRANWKILVENYQECLHCSWVHPELVDIVPVYKTGSVVDPTRPDGGVTCAATASA